MNLTVTYQDFFGSNVAKNLSIYKAHITPGLARSSKVGPKPEFFKASKQQQDKVAKVMREFKEGSLKSSSGKKVTDRDQAIAIALSEAGLSKADIPKEHLKEMIEEHERLVDVLDSESHEDDKKEAKKQKRELKEYKEELKKAYDTLGVK